MINLANRVTALVAAMVTCVIMIVQMLQHASPLSSIRYALLAGCMLGAVSWMATMVGSSVVSDAVGKTGESK